MAEVVIKIVDNDNGNVSFFMEVVPPLPGDDKDQFTEAQMLGMAFFEHILKNGIYSLLEPPKKNNS